MPKISALPEATSLADADDLLLAQSGQTKKVGWDTVRQQTFSASRWTTIATSKYTATPASAIQINMSDNSDFDEGLPVRYTFGGTAYYGIVYYTTPASNGYIQVYGAPLDVGQALTKLEVGTPEMAVQETFYIAGAAYGDAVRDILALVGYQYVIWERPQAYLVAFMAVHRIADTSGTQPKINVRVDGNLVSSYDSNLGILMVAAATWAAESPANNQINPTNYGIAYGDALEIACTRAGTNLDAADLTVTCIFVLA